MDNNNIEEINSLINEIKQLKVLLQPKPKAKEFREIYVFENYTIPAAGTYITKAIDNENYEWMRIIANIVFNAGATAGIDIDIAYNGSIYLSDALDIKHGELTATGNISKPIDISHLSGFNFYLNNLDTMHSAKINLLKIIIYNKHNKSAE